MPRYGLLIATLVSLLLLGDLSARTLPAPAQAPSAPATTGTPVLPPPPAAPLAETFDRQRTQIASLAQPVAISGSRTVSTTITLRDDEGRQFQSLELLVSVTAPPERAAGASLAIIRPNGQLTAFESVGSAAAGTTAATRTRLKLGPEISAAPGPLRVVLSCEQGGGLTDRVVTCAALELVAFEDIPGWEPTVFPGGANNSDSGVNKIEFGVVASSSKIEPLDGPFMLIESKIQGGGASIFVNYEFDGPVMQLPPLTPTDVVTASVHWARSITGEVFGGYGAAARLVLVDEQAATPQELLRVNIPTGLDTSWTTATSEPIATNLLRNAPTRYRLRISTNPWGTPQQLAIDSFQLYLNGTPLTGPTLIPPQPDDRTFVGIGSTSADFLTHTLSIPVGRYFAGKGDRPRALTLRLAVRGREAGTAALKLNGKSLGMLELNPGTYFHTISTYNKDGIPSDQFLAPIDPGSSDLLPTTITNTLTLQSTTPIAVDWAGIFIAGDIRPIVFVFGWAGDDTTFEKFSGWADRDFIANYRITTTDFARGVAEDSQAIQLLKAHGIEEARHRFGAEKVNVVAFSRGGVVSRLGLEIDPAEQAALAGHIDALVTISSPHNGTDFPQDRFMFKCDEGDPQFQVDCRLRAIEMSEWGALRTNYGSACTFTSPAMEQWVGCRKQFVQQEHLATTSGADQVRFFALAGVSFDIGSVSSTYPWRNTTEQEPYPFPADRSDVDQAYLLAHAGLTAIHNSPQVYHDIVMLLRYSALMPPQSQPIPTPRPLAQSVPLLPVQAAVSETLQLEVLPDRLTYSPGQPAVILARVIGLPTGNSAPPLEASVEGRTYPLADNGTNGDAVAGDGWFATTLPGFAANGYHEIMVATTVGGQRYEQTQSVAVVDQLATITAIGAPTPAEPTEDGRWGSLLLPLSVNAASPGLLQLSAELITPAGEFVASTHQLVEVITGTQQFRLRIDGAAINRSRLDGPYVVRGLTLDGQLGDDLTLYRSSEEARLQEALPWTMFAGDPLSFALRAGPHAEAGELIFPGVAQTDRERKVRLVGELYNRLGERVASVEARATVSGEQALDLRFPLPPLASVPYELRTVSISDEQGGQARYYGMAEPLALWGTRLSLPLLAH